MNPILTDGSKLFNDLLMQLGSFECQLKVGLTYSKQLMGTSATDLSQKYQSGFPGAAFPKLLLLLMAQKTATCLTDTYIMEKRGAMGDGTRPSWNFRVPYGRIYTKNAGVPSEARK